MMPTTDVAAKNREESPKPSQSSVGRKALTALVRRLDLMVCAALGGYWVIESWSLGLGSGERPGVGWWPFVAGTAVVAVALLNMLAAVPAEAEHILSRRSLRPAATVAMLVVTALAMVHVSGPVALGVFVYLHTRLLGRLSQVSSAIAGVTTAVVVELLFVQLFQIRFF